MDRWTINSRTIEATVTAMGAMMAPVVFTLEDSRKVQPFKISDWADQTEAVGLPPVTRYLRGDFPCVPFGAPAPPPSTPNNWARLFEANPEFTETHGVCANHTWSLVAQTGSQITLGIDYPATHPVARVEKTIRLTDVVNVELHIFARRATRITVGVHPVLDIGDRPHGAIVEAPFRFARTFPGDYVPGISRLAIDALFERLDAAPLRGGDTVDLTKLPLSFEAEDVVQLCGVDGWLRLSRADYILDFTWDACVWPSLLLGLANGGRREAPYHGRWRALYAEPIAAAFGLGSSIGASLANPIAQKGVATAINLDPAAPWTTTYRFAVHTPTN